MDRRTHETPMDFEWGNQSGPVDVTSPFHKLSQQYGGLRRGFESPVKRESSASQTESKAHFTFGAPTAPQAPPFRNPSFTTPRKPFDTELFSEASGAESSPADNADAEDTPEVPKSSKNMPAFTGGRKQAFEKYGAHFQGTSPSHPKLRRGKYVDAVQKARKRKRTDRDLVLSERRESFDSESDAVDTRVRHRKNGHSHSGSDSYNNVYPPPKQGWFASILAAIEARPSLPFVLSYYIQTGLNVFVVGLFMYLALSLVDSIRSEIRIATEKATERIRQEIAACTTHYVSNACSPGPPLPALAGHCKDWEACMNQDATQVGRASVTAHTWATVFNSFTDEISWKAVVLFLLIFFVGIVANNTVFPSLRAKYADNHPAPYQFPPPPTPSHLYNWENPALNSENHQYQYSQDPPQTPRRLDNGYNLPMKSLMPGQTPRQGSPRKLVWNQ